MKTKTNHDESRLKRIALASLRPCPEIVPLIAGRINRTGQRFSPYGAAPVEPYHTFYDGVAFRARDGSLHRSRFMPDEAAARRVWKRQQLRAAVEFLRELREMASARIRLQEVFWLGRAGDESTGEGGTR